MYSQAHYKADGRTSAVHNAGTTFANGSVLRLEMLANQMV
jgi:hypothetical protein